jgi:UDP-glucose 4-epimerase
VRLLVTGGAGYIGSVVTAQLLERGHEVVVLDDLSTGHQDAVPEGARLVVGDIRDRRLTESLLGDGPLDGVVHFAAKALVGESTEHPERYYDNNVYGSFCLLEAMRVAGVRRIIFSSTAATYGEPEQVPILETAATQPTNPYGASKLAVDHMLTAYATAHDFAAASLRYFNAAGAYGRLGERHGTETHLIPIVLQVAAGTRESVSIYGSDYPTDDGTALRDYVHVRDLGEAHLLALENVQPGAHAVYNLGNGVGYSVRQVIECAREITGQPISAIEAPRRVGDPAVLVASNSLIREALGWAPQFTLHDMIRDAWEFAQRNR